MDASGRAPGEDGLAHSSAVQESRRDVRGADSQKERSGDRRGPHREPLLPEGGPNPLHDRNRGARGPRRHPADGESSHRAAGRDAAAKRKAPTGGSGLKGIPPHRLAPWCVVKIRAKFQKVPIPSLSRQLWFAPLSVSGGNWCSCPFAVI